MKNEKRPDENPHLRNGMLTQDVVGSERREVFWIDWMNHEALKANYEECGGERALMPVLTNGPFHLYIPMESDRIEKGCKCLINRIYIKYDT